MSFRTACSAAACAVLVTLAPAARAQDWPNRSVLTISPLTAGNAADTVARIVLDQVGRQVGQSFVIENRPGAGGTTGSAAAAKADPDGYTLFLLTASQGSYAALHKSLPYDPARDFIPVAMFGVQHIPFRGPVEAFTEVMTGRVDFYFLPVAPALPNIRDGKLVALAVSTPKRAPMLPNVPTVAEAGYPRPSTCSGAALGFPRRRRAP